ncbi:hypothetical protein AGMMS50276_32660 [Synergistales bacterium]|nr:hypothetical protein AGMMS50276_32660 [Synergistales bacterium]
MPLYAQIPRHWDAGVDEMLKNIHKVLSAVDAVVDCSIIGGETLLYSESELCRLIDDLKASRKIIKIAVTTNGTLIPGEKLISCLRDPRVYVIISDYGRVSAKVGELVKLLEKNGVLYNLIPFSEKDDGWVDFGKVFPRGRSCEELKDLFFRCKSASSCNPMIGDRLYPCGRASRLTDLGLKDTEYGDFAVLSDDPKETRQTIEKFLAMDSIPSCDWCDSILGEKVKPAVQLEANAIAAGSEALSGTRT